MRAIRLLLWVLSVLSFIAPLDGAVIGTVINIDGKPLPGAKVSLFSPELIAAQRSRLLSAEPQRTPLATVLTDSNGRFSIGVPKEHPVADLRVEASGYAPMAGWFAADEDAGALLMTQASPVRGTITANGKPAANATVVILGATEYTTKTDAEGHYSAPDPSKWASRVLVLHPDFALVDEPVLPFGAKKNADFTMTAGVVVSGRVVSDDGQTPAGEVPIFLDGWPVAKSAADGTFTIAHARKAWNTVEARSGNRIAQRARPDGALPALKLAKGATIGGSVRDVKSQLPVAGARVVIAPTGPFRDASLDAITDAKGAYTLTPIAGGTYDVRAQRPGYGINGLQAVNVKGVAAVQKAFLATPHGRISGSVVDDDKRPVSAAKLSARAATRDNNVPSFLRAGGGGVSEGYSAPDGHFVLGDVETDAELQIDAVKRGYPAGRSPSLKLAAGERKSGVTITIPLGLAVTGRVTDKDRKPLSGVGVEPIESSGDPMASLRRVTMSAMQGGRNENVRTGGDGTFTTRVKEGTYDLAFKGEGYSAKLLRGIKVDSATKPVEVMLDPGVEIIGHVMRSGAGVEGVNVIALAQDTFAAAMTGSDGSFRIADLNPGQMMLVINKPEAFIAEMRPVAAPARNFVIELPPGGRIPGRVVDKMTHQAVTSFLAGVTAPRGGIPMPPMQKQFTTDDGTFMLESVKPGSTQVVVNAPGYIMARSPTIEVEDGKTLPDVEVGLETGAKLTGRVTGPEGTPLAGVSVRNVARTAGSPPTSMLEDSPTTDANGEYTIESLEAGEKTFSFSRSGYQPQQKTVTIVSGKDARLDVQISNGIRATGLVVTDGGVPIADASVRATSDDGSRENRADAGGAFTFEGLAPGNYTFMAVKTGFAPGVLRDVDIASSGPVRIILKSGGVITGHVSGLTAQELEQTTVYAGVAGGTGTTAPVDSAGNFRMEGVPSGTVRIGARTGVLFGGSTRSAATKIVDFDGGTAQVEIDFKSNTAIHGRITRNGAPVANALVAFLPRDGKSQTTASASADAEGRYELSGLDDGTYTVRTVDMALLGAPFITQYEVHGSDTFDITIKTVTLRGRVTGAIDTRPLSDVNVELRISGQPAFGGRTAQTDASGNFVLENVAAGTYQITADKPGFEREEREITIADSAPEELQFKLSPATPP